MPSNMVPCLLNIISSSLKGAKGDRHRNDAILCHLFLLFTHHAHPWIIILWLSFSDVTVQKLRCLCNPSMHTSLNIPPSVSHTLTWRISDVRAAQELRAQADPRVPLQRDDTDITCGKRGMESVACLVETVHIPYKYLPNKQHS